MSNPFFSPPSEPVVDHVLLPAEDDFTPPHDKNDEWDEGDIAALESYVAQGLTQSQIAEKLGRTKSGVNSKLYRMRSSAY